MPRPRLRLILLLLILAVLGPPGIPAERSVGCLFSEGLCLEEEWCYDDSAFGRCLPSTTDLDGDDFNRYMLEREGIHQLNKELRRLFALGYRWSHGYTQCRLQALLYAFKHDLEFDANACSHLSDNDLEGALRALEGQVELEPQEIAIIKYTPSVEDSHASFADEVYYPPADVKAHKELRQKILSPNAIPLDMPDPYADLVMKRAWYPPMKKKDITPFFDRRYGVARYRRFDPEPATDSLAFLQKYENEYPEGPLGMRPEIVLDENNQKKMQHAVEFLSQMELKPEEIRQIFSPENYKKLRKYVEAYFDSDQTLENPALRNVIQQRIAELRNDISDERSLGLGNLQDLEQDNIRFPLTYNTPDNFRAGYEMRDEMATTGDHSDEERYLDEVRIYEEPEDQDAQEPTESGSGHPMEIFFERKYSDILNPQDEIFRERQQKQNEENERFERKWGKIQHPQVVYSEGGADEPETQEEIINMDDDDFANLWRYNMEFKRPERLDVKKPGPPFDPLISDEPRQKVRPVLKKSQHEISPKSAIKKDPRNPNLNSLEPSFTKKAPENLYVHVTFRDHLPNWKRGDYLQRNITKLLHMDPSDFTDSQVDDYFITFKVNPANSRGYNESDVAKKIELIKNELESVSGATVESIGIGPNREKVQEVFFSRINTENQYIVLFLVCGVLVALILASTVLILVRRYIKTKEKLRGLSRPDTEASKDYQDLCRARMATKGQSGGEVSGGKGRITSLSKETEQSTSSRSSTSSWSEEPALNNMDISTGHMVLSYMEDHLKNKDRLEQEWVALCAYVAEPCETSVAMKKSNIGKNRYPEVVPYDHARVVLNELSNVSGCDYINASSITDHDPRNPAYIATQGPLPHTAPDFWQMIWEQGAVVIVMLSRLTEGGNAMCHRYWPEEGSEIYHIYEVHLVSEHIWCDDYLVRSFYLKNVRTGETRTVTQFHFLSWPEAAVPASTKALLEFRRKVNKSYRGRSCPIVVHCSDGAGRTGTYCLIDMVLSRMAKGAKEIDIAATLEHLRDQRPKMVATKQQFEFVLTAVAEEVHAILKALPPQPAPTTVAPEKSEK